MKSETRKCQNCKNEFIIEPDDFGFYEKIKVPPPTFCPECRLQRRLMWRNERTFYQRQCDLCKKNIISSFTREQPFPVYCQKCWWGDDWDPYSFGIDFDFSKSFFEQFQKLKKKVPILNMQNDDGIASLNSEYSQDFAYLILELFSLMFEIVQKMTLRNQNLCQKNTGPNHLPTSISDNKRGTAVL